MSYERGSRPDYISEEKVAEDYTYQKGEWGKIVGHEFSEVRNIDPMKLPKASQFADSYIASLQKKGATVKYIRISSVSRQFRDYSCVRFTVEECIFKADPFIIDDWLIALGLIVVAGVFIAVLTRPAWLKLMGVSPIEALGYDFGSILIILAFAILAFILLGGSLVWGKRKVKTRGG